jgi:hypothetical protein
MIPVMKEVIKVIELKVMTSEEEIAHSVPFKCIGAAHEKNY